MEWRGDAVGRKLFHFVGMFFPGSEQRIQFFPCLCEHIFHVCMGGRVVFTRNKLWTGTLTKNLCILQTEGNNEKRHFISLTSWHKTCDITFLPGEKKCLVKSFKTRLTTFCTKLHFFQVNVFQNVIRCILHLKTLSFVQLKKIFFRLNKCLLPSSIQLLFWPVKLCCKACKLASGCKVFSRVSNREHESARLVQKSFFCSPSLTIIFFLVLMNHEEQEGK